MTSCKSLYLHCLEFCIPRIENYSRQFPGKSGCKWIESLAGPIVEDLLRHAFHRSNNQMKSSRTIWKTEWKIFFTSKISFALLNWDKDLIEHVGNTCQNLQKCHVVLVNDFDPELVLKLPKSVTLLDFDGELVKAGKTTEPLLFDGDDRKLETWLPHAERILKALKILRSSISEYSSPSSKHLSHLHLGTVKTSASDLKILLKNCPNLKLLRHYQMVTALYELHADDWKNKKPLPRYCLKNLDVDFSHVVRCRMSPEWVLSPNALQLAVILCPSATSIRVRFDCSTPHDVLNPLLSLSKLKEFSAVCVSSGERTLLDFGDMTPIIEHHGPTNLTHLELKVIEEVEIHVIVESCPNLESLVLSGCGYTTPATCSDVGCHRYERGTFRKLRFLFYADGDDFSWDHGVPECFWKASLCSPGPGKGSKLQGLFLEYPRISPQVFRDIFHRPSPHVSTLSPFPKLQFLSICRFEELTVDDLASIFGLTMRPPIPCKTLKYVRLSECHQITESEEKRLNRWVKDEGLRVKIHVDR